MLDKLGDEDDAASEDSDDTACPTVGVEENEASNKPQHERERWRLELERVAPALRLKITADSLDWRGRHAQMKAYRQELVTRYSSQSGQLARLRTSIASCLDKMAARESTLNTQFAPLVRQYGEVLEQLNAIRAENKELNAQIAEHQETLNELNGKLEAVKQKTESKGTSMNDNSPLLNAQKAVSSIKRDIQDLDFQLVILLWLLTSKDSQRGGVDARVTPTTY